MYTNAFNCDAFHLTGITSKRDVELFADYLVNGLNINIHPDTPFGDYISYQDKTPTFTKQDAEIGDRLMDECFEVCEKCGADVYEIMGDVLFARLTGNKEKEA